MESLCDELLLHIFKYLRGHDLISIIQAIPRYKQLINDKSLWTWIDCRDKKSESQLVEYFNGKVHENTAAYMLEAQERKATFITKDLLNKWATFNSLTILALENQEINGNEFILGDFPQSLVELSLNKCQISNYYGFFQFCSRRLSALRVLTLEFCQSLDENLLLPFGNLPMLEILSLYGCMDMKDAVVPNTMGFEYGFKKLKVLDVRCTGFGNELLRVTSKMLLLGELYFHCYFDYVKTQLHDIDKDNDGDEQVAAIPEADGLDLKGQKFVADYMHTLTDAGLIYYRKCCTVEEYEPPKSVLYARPFAKCKCLTANVKLKDKESDADVTTNGGAPCLSSTSTTKSGFANKPSSSASSSSTSTSTSTSTKRPHSDDEDGGDDAPHSGKQNGTCKRARTRPETFKVEFQFNDHSTIRSSRRPPPDHHCVIDVNLGRHIIAVEHRADGNHGRLLAECNDGGLVVEEIDDAVNGRPVRPVINLGNLRVRFIYPQMFERRSFITLNALMLRGSRAVTDDGLHSLRQLHLDLIDLTGTSVTREGLAAFRETMPHCRIVHESLCTCQPR